MEKNTKINNHTVLTPYNIGIDIGDASVGLAVTDPDNNPVKIRGKNYLCSNLFDAGMSAANTRIKRGTKRRYQRRKNRIFYLQTLIGEEVLKKDKDFFLRLKESSLYAEDKSTTDFYTLFNDKDFNEKDYKKAYKTIYHLRNDLVHWSENHGKDEKPDVRLVYLALHHIIKYRGNFLYEGEEFSSKSMLLKPALKELSECVSEWLKSDGIDFSDDVDKILSDVKLMKKDKRKICIDTITKSLETANSDGIKDIAVGITDGLLNNQVNFKKMFELSTKEKVEFKLTDDEFDSKLANNITDDLQIEVVLALKKACSAFILGGIMLGGDTISESMIKKYDKHQDDLKYLKLFVKNNFPEKYNKFFNNKFSDDDMKKSATNQKKEPYKCYSEYIAHPKKCSNGDLGKTIKKEFKIEENDKNEKGYKCYKKIADDIDNGTFLPKINSTDNGSIPYQLHLEEASKIIDNIKNFYPEIYAQKDKILSIIKFRIPYYVGPLAHSENQLRRFDWMEKQEGKEDEKIYPWNFDNIVDVDKTAKSFIRRMTNKCTYLYSEDVIPRNSLLYSEFVVLNELNKIRIKDKNLSVDTKQKIYNDLFKSRKKVSIKALKKWLKDNKHTNVSEADITGCQKEDCFAGSLTSYIDFKRILGEENVNKNEEMIEQLIEWITIFEDKKILKRKIEDKYSKRLNNKQIQSICNLKYTGWSSLSAKLLTGLYYTDKFGEVFNIMDLLYDSSENPNFMQIINNKKYGFTDKIEKYNEKLFKASKQLTYNDINKLPCSPAVKKAVWQCIKMIEEVVKVMGHEPDHIFIEVTRSEGEKKRSVTRYNQMKKRYDNVKDNTDFDKCAQELKTYNDKKEKLASDRLYLYLMQNGKCMYTGERLEITNLSSYEIDHIIPQSYIKDDSLNNRVLVLKEANQRKKDSLLLNDDIINKMKGFWKSLLDAKLITPSKYYRLIRRRVEEDDLKHFANRQLVETSQICKRVVELLDKHYDCSVGLVRAGLTSDFRKKYGLYKSREINDFHHAHDAYLAAVIGSYITNCYPKLSDSINYGDYRKYVQKNNKANDYGFIIGSMDDKRFEKETKELIWNGKDEIEKVRKILNYKDCIIVKKQRS